jgi:transposase
MGKQKYHVNLTNEEKKRLKGFLRSKKHSMESKTRAKILLNLDESNGNELSVLREIASHHGVSDITLWKVRKKYVEQGLDAALERRKRKTPPVPAKVTGEVEAHIIATCCSAPPEGRCRWSMKMIADKIVLDGVVDSISDETVRTVLKKRNLSHN